MTKRGAKLKQTNSRFRSYVLDTLNADTDFINILDTGNYSTMALEIRNLTSPDEIEVYGYTAYETSTGVLLGDGIFIKNSSDTNPFTTDGLNQVNIQAFAAIKIVRNGVASGAIEGYLSLGY